MKNPDLLLSKIQKCARVSQEETLPDEEMTLSDSGWLSDFFEFTKKRPLLRKRFLKRELGIEIEVENFKKRIPEFDFWTPVTDGSLRINGIEFVSTKIPFRNLEQALRELDEKVFQITSDLLTTYRTSVHVHINFSLYTFQELYTFLALYLFYERELFLLAGIHRRDSPFCRPMASGIPQLASLNLERLAENRGNFFRSRYWAVNLNSLEKHGSLEFRHMEGTTNIERIFHWCMVIGLLCDYVKRLPPHKIKQKLLEMLEHHVKDGSLEKIQALDASIFGPYAPPTIHERDFFGMCILLKGLKCAD